jgi:hypothetical protein
MAMEWRVVMYGIAGLLVPIFAHFFSAAVQLTSSVTGDGPTSRRGWLSKNLWPSVVTRY